MFDRPWSSSAAASCRLLRSYSDMAAAPRWAAIGVFLRQIGKVLLAEAALRLGTRRHRFGQSYCDPCFVARKDLWTIEVAAIGYGIERLGFESGLRLLGHSCA